MRQERVLSQDEEVPRTLLRVHGAAWEYVVLEARGRPGHGACAQRRWMRQLNALHAVEVRPGPALTKTGQARWWLLLIAMCYCEHHATIAAAI